MSISKELCNEVRRDIRCNGNYCLHWMTGDQLELATKLIELERAKDVLAERVNMITWLKKHNMERFTIKDLYWLVRSW